MSGDKRRMYNSKGKNSCLFFHVKNAERAENFLLKFIFLECRDFRKLKEREAVPFTFSTRLRANFK